MPRERCNLHELDTNRISCELVRHLRGHRAQQALSRRLGFGSNVVHTWETGRRAPEVSQFLRLAQLCGVAVGRELAGFFNEAALAQQGARFTTPRGVTRLVELLVGATVKSHVAARVGIDRTTLTRWLAGKTVPRLPELLRLVDVTTQRLLPFVQLFADPRELPSTRAAYEDLAAQQRLAYELPWSHAFLRALEVAQYAALPHHRPGFLAEHLGLELADEERYLEALSLAGQIRWSGSHWVLQRVLTVDTRTDPQRDRGLKAHWARVALARLEGSGAPDEALFSYNLFAVSEESFQRIRQLHLDYYVAVRALVDESPRADRVVLMNAQLVPLEGRRRP
jgi:transcriptional regulator with XRE-family HTH domain